MSELEYCVFCDGGYAHSGICDKCADEFAKTEREQEVSRLKKLVKDCHVIAGNLEQERNAIRTALKALWQWTKAEVEHFEANTPDDFIVALVENALKGGNP